MSVTFCANNQFWSKCNGEFFCLEMFYCASNQKHNLPVCGEAVFLLQVCAVFGENVPNMRVKMTNIRSACSAQVISSRSGLSGLATSRQHTTAVPVGWFAPS